MIRSKQLDAKKLLIVAISLKVINDTILTARYQETAHCCNIPKGDK